MTQMPQKTGPEHKNTHNKKILVFILCAALVLVSIQAVTASSNENDLILVGTRNWQDVIAATPFAISHVENVSRPLLIVPTGVDTGRRYGWVENGDQVKYGVPPIISKLKSGNVSTVIINLKDENGFVYYPSEVAEEDAIGGDVNVTKEFIDTAHEEGLEVFAALTCFRDSITVEKHPEWAQMNEDDERSKEWICPLNDEYREYLLNLTQEVLSTYDIDGVVLSDFGYAGSDYCFCDRCKRGFWNDTGIDPGKVDLSNRYSPDTRNWFDWRSSEITDFFVSLCIEAKEIDAGIAMGAKLQNPLLDYDPSGYEYKELTSLVEIMLIDPIQTRDIRIIASDISDKTGIYVFWSEEEVGDRLSVQNVEATITYMGAAKEAGARGVVLDYSIAYTPIWLELKTMPSSTSWFIDQYSPQEITVVGNADISLASNLNVTRISGTDIFDTAAKIASCWTHSQGVVLVNCTDYHSAVQAAPLASYLGYPILYVDAAIPNSTADALDTDNAIVIGAVSPDVIRELEAMNISVLQGDASEMLISEMAKNGEEVNAVVFTNTRDIELTLPKPEPTNYEREIGDIQVITELFPAEVPCDQEGSSYYITVNVKNTGTNVVEDIIVQDTMRPRRTVKSATATVGNGDISKKREITWDIGDLYPDEVATLRIEGTLDFAMDADEEKRIDEGVIINFDGIKKFLPEEERRIIAETPSCEYIKNINYPVNATVGSKALIIWEITANTTRTYVKYYPPDSGGSESTEWLEGGPGKYGAAINLTMPGTWGFKIRYCNDSYCCYSPRYQINVSALFSSINTTAFAHAKIPKLSLTSAQIAAARKAPVIDINKEPLEIIPIEEEESLKKAVLDYKIRPDYLIVVGGIRSVPFVDTGLMQDCNATTVFDIYRDYDIQFDKDVFHEVSTGRIIGLDVYDTSAVTARTIAYEKTAEKNGDWKSKALVVTNPPSWPQSPTAGDIKKYMEGAGLSVEFEDYETANCPEVMMEMNNGKNIVYFYHHGAEDVWGLNDWALLEPNLDTTDVKMLRLAPQSTHAYTCLSGRLKGGWYSESEGAEFFYEPFDLDRSMALAFLEAGSANYIGSNSLSNVFVTEDFSKDFYQSMIYGNMTVGEALTHAKNLYVLKYAYSEEMQGLYPHWEGDITRMINATSKQFILLGDPMFKPLLPRIPEKPIEEKIISWGCENEDEYIVTMTITPLNESATKWTYWFEQPVVDGEVTVRALPSLIGELELPIEAEEIVVSGMSGVVWHGEDDTGDKKIVLFPVVDPMPKLNEAREFEIRYTLVPKICWQQNLTAGWSMFSSPVQLYEADIEQVLADVPYSAVFYFDSANTSWLYYLKDDPEASTLKVIEPGKAYLIEMTGQAELNLTGRAVELPFELSLSTGWNMIGIPSTEAVKIAALNVTANEEEYTFDDAVQKGIVSAFIFRYEGGNWIFSDSSETLKPGVGYYIEVFEDCELIFPRIC